MGHTDPLFVIPVGTVFGALAAYAAINPEPFLELRTTGWPKTLIRVFGRRGGVLVLRLAALATAGMLTWLVVHASLSLLGR